MDRSSFKFVGSTYDLEKRQAFKAKLANKIDVPQPKELPAIDNTFNGVPPGGILIHPSLGEGTLVEVDHSNNEVLINFGSKGLIGLVLSQAKFFVHAPIKEDVRISDDPFLGSEIQSRLLAPQDRDYREVDFSKIISPDFVDFEKSFLPVGSAISHPSLGDGVLVEVNHDKNEMVIDFGHRGLITLVLSQVKSFVSELQKEIKVSEDPFLGDKIQRDGPIKPDSTQRDLDYSKVVSPDFMDSKISFLEPGAKVIHKDLGECTIVSFDKKANEIVLDSKKHGFVSLVLSQVRSTITPVDFIRKESKVIEDPFLGDNIQRDGAIKQDSIQRDLDYTKVVSPDFIVSEKTFIPEGSSVWHPDLGVCTVVSVDEKQNNLTLSTSTAVIDMVLSQVRSKLRIIETAVEHVPMQPLVRDLLAPQIPQYKSRGDVSIRLPAVFKTWQKNQQFMFLTRNQKLTTEQANDVFSVMDGNKPMFHTITIDWQSHEETQADITPGPKPLSTSTDTIRILPSIFNNKNLWHPDFGECSVFSIEGNQLILMTSVGQVPCVLDATVPKLAVLDATAKVEHAPKRLGAKAPTPTIKDEVQPRVPLILPNQFNSWKVLEQYQYLTGNRHLTPEDANAFLAGSADKFIIQWTNELPESSKRSEFKEQLLKRVEQASVEPTPPITPVPVDSSSRRVIEEVNVVKKTVIKKVPVDLPIDFKNWTASGQYVFLTRTKQFTFNEANDVLDILNGKSINSNTEYIITWNGSPIVQTPTGQRDIQETIEEVMVKKNVVKTISVSLPSIFKNWASSGQFGFLTRTRQLNFDEANDVLAVLKGDLPQNNQIKYEIVWSE